ncbi:MAG: NAD(P)-dependent oxidoreductase [Actinobacteria bacterium]|nr:MAG: NAD(P)-dependent oxidoreductase [Actinomycetota bacterium]
MRVAVVGLGLMGEAIAERVLSAGHELTVYNRSPGRTEALERAGATVAPSLGAVWDTADVCITSLTDDAALRAVTGGESGVLSGGRSGRTLIDMSTVSPSASAEIAREASASGVSYLRAPVSGNPSVVRAGNLSIMASGDRAAFDAVESTLRDIGPNVFYVGDGEQARVLKLALNLMIAATAELIAEAVVLGEAGGLDRATLLEVMGASATGSPFVKYKSAPLVARDYTTTFSLDNMHKDLVMALAAAADAGVPLPVTARVDELVQECIAAGMGQTDLMGLLPRLQRAAGVTPDITA